MKKIFLLLVMALAVVGCQKEEDKIEKPNMDWLNSYNGGYNTGGGSTNTNEKKHKFRASNNSPKSNYRVRIYNYNDTYNILYEGVVGAGEAMDFYLKQGKYKVHYYQLNGYLVYPTEKWRGIYIDGYYYFQFPFED